MTTIQKRLEVACSQLSGTFHSQELADKVNFDGTGSRSLSPAGAAKRAHGLGFIEEAGRLNGRGGHMTKIWRSTV